LFAVLDRSAGDADTAATVPAAAAATIGFRRAALHLGGLWALAFAQPLFDMLGHNAQFFVARGSTRGDILVLALGYTLVPPLAGAVLVWAAGRLHPAAGRALMLALVALLVAGLVLPPLGDALAGSALAVPAALAVGAAGAALYARVAAVRSFVTVLSGAPLIVLFLFLVVSPVGGLVLPGDASGSVAGPARSSTPIVHIVLDELPTSTLTDARGEIDARLFPNLARFARTATWYRAATTVDDLTTGAVPAQLTGELPDPDALPTARDHPRSLFTLFGRSHDLTVVEPITDVCPERLCGTLRPSTADRLRSLEADLEVVVQQQLLPSDMRRSLPAIDRVWEGFGTASEPARGEIHGGSLLIRDVLTRLAADDATAGFQHALQSLDRRGSKPPLLFVHSTLPHGAWRFLPDGSTYPLDGFEYPGLDDHTWRGPQWLVDQSFARHVLQAQYADRLVGLLLGKLRSTGRFDDAVIVIAADHGVSFRSGQPRRAVTSGNIGDIAPVPLLVKYPGQHEARVEDGAVRTIDVLPTIAKAAGVELPWDADGMPADDRPVEPDAAIAISHEGEHVLTRPLRDVLAQRDERAAAEARLLRDGAYALGPRPDLLGRRVAAAGGGRRASAAFVNGRIDGVPPGVELALAIDGVVRATTWSYRTRVGDHTVFSALVPPSSLRAGSRAVVLRVLPGDRLRAIEG
jgi:hypothetical protein